MGKVLDGRIVERPLATMEEVKIVAVPFPSQGHLNALLHFSLRLSARGLSVHFASSASHNRQAKLRLHGWGSLSLQTIQFHDLPVPPFPAPAPDPDSPAKFPNHVIPAFYASMNLQAPLGSLLRSLSVTCRRLVVIHDTVMPFASHEAAAIANAETFRFQCVPTFAELPHLWDLSSADQVIKPRQEVLDVILPQFDRSLTAEIEEFLNKQNFDTDESGTLFNTCRAIEGEFLDLLAGVQRYRGKKLFAVGPLHPTSVESDGGHECLKWLDKQPRGSVVYVSFGSTSTLSDEQIKQLAIGLKSSGQRFMWVLRDADRGDIFADDTSKNQQQRKLPAGFEEEIQDMGMIVRGWAPQLEVLAHRSTGAFVSHCGWNSCMESLSMGVPIIAWPMHSDQPRNAVMVTDYLKVGIAVRDWARHEEVVLAGEIEEVIKRMMADEEGKEIKKRAKLLGEEARLAVSEGGTSHADLSSFIAHICR